MNGSGRARDMTQAQVTRSTSQRPPPFTYLSQNPRYLRSEVSCESTHANFNFQFGAKNSEIGYFHSFATVENGWKFFFFFWHCVLDEKKDSILVPIYLFDKPHALF